MIQRRLVRAPLALALVVALALAVMAAACGRPPMASHQADWPPILVAGTDPPDGVTFVIDGLDARLTNGSGVAIWLAPPTVAVWQGWPWVEGSTPDGSKRLDPGESFQTTLPASEDIRRAAVRIWPTSDTRDRPDNLPWLLWLEVPPGS